MSATSCEVTDLPSGGSMYCGSMLGGSGVGRLPCRRREVDLVAGLVERLERADQLLAPVAEFREDDEDALQLTLLPV